MSKKKKIRVSLLPILILPLVFILFFLAKNGFEKNVHKEIIQGEHDLEPELVIHMINVGNADAILIIHKDHAAIIDAGNINSYSVLDYLINKNIKKIDLMFLTHPHQDHYGQMEKIIKSGIIVEHFITTHNKSEPEDKHYLNLIKELTEKKIPISISKIGSYFSMGDVTLFCLSPCRIYKETNDNSLVLMGYWDKIKFLLTGDAQKESEVDMIKNISFIKNKIIENKIDENNIKNKTVKNKIDKNIKNEIIRNIKAEKLPNVIKDNLDLSADVLKVAHHGSNTSSSDSFIRLVNPRLALVSTYDHLNIKVEKRFNFLGINFFSTKEHGNIVVEFYKNAKIVVKTEKNNSEFIFENNFNQKTVDENVA